MPSSVELSDFGAWDVLLPALGLALLMGLASFSRRRPRLGWFQRGRHLRVVESAALDTRNRLYLVRIGDRPLVLAAGESGVTVLLEEVALNDALTADDAGNPRETIPSEGASAPGRGSRGAGLAAMVGPLRRMPRAGAFEWCRRLRAPRG